MKVFAERGEWYWQYRLLLQQLDEIEEHTMIRTTSAQALHDLTESGERERKSLRIVELLKKYPAGLTRREIEEKTGLRSNQVSGRVRELINQERLKEGKMRPCSITWNVVNVVCAPEDEE